jgi:hypothetical protein
MALAEAGASAQALDDMNSYYKEWRKAYLNDAYKVGV